MQACRLRAPRSSARLCRTARIARKSPRHLRRARAFAPAFRLVSRRQEPISATVERAQSKHSRLSTIISRLIGLPQSLPGPICLSSLLFFSLTIKEGARRKVQSAFKKLTLSITISHSQRSPLATAFGLSWRQLHWQVKSESRERIIRSATVKKIRRGEHLNSQQRESNVSECHEPAACSATNDEASSRRVNHRSTACSKRS